MIVVDGISKRFGSARALQDVSFSLKLGEVVGFVGPNGAGKTTTLRILSGFLEADAGVVEIAGHNIRTERAQACASIGYMSERAPLYEDMRVQEFLRFRAQIKGVPRRGIAKRVDQVVEELELGVLRQRLISRISKGFKQRVALADALIANPKILLLDEPTSGLDPIQRRNFRKLLLVLSQRRCVLFSSHILPEVEAVVSRFLILSHGVLVADGDLDHLRNQAGLGIAASTEDVFTALVENGTE